jgi:hypothetical protein
VLFIQIFYYSPTCTVENNKQTKIQFYNHNSNKIKGINDKYLTLLIDQINGFRTKLRKKYRKVINITNTVKRI